MKLSFLINMGLLQPGENLEFRQTLKRSVHRACVGQDGSITLDSGETFQSPSTAAARAAGVRAINGWRAWIVVRTNESLADVRAIANNRSRE